MSLETIEYASARSLRGKQASLRGKQARENALGGIAPIGNYARRKQSRTEKIVKGGKIGATIGLGVFRTIGAGLHSAGNKAIANKESWGNRPVGNFRMTGISMRKRPKFRF